MNIIRKNSSRSEIYIFQFETQNEFNLYVSSLRKCIEDQSSEELQTIATNVINRLVSRVDDKYASDEYALSGMLFPGEMTEFAWAMSMMNALRYI